MKRLDRFLRNWRYGVVAPHVPERSAVLDIGGFDGSFLTKVYDKIDRGVCIDPFAANRKDPKVALINCRVTDKLPFPDSSFDVVTMIAVFEHLSHSREDVAAEVYRVLKDNGVALLTVPSGGVDRILKVLLKLRLIDGMSTFEEHDNFDSADTVEIFGKRGFELRRWLKFQLGLNNLFVFRKLPRTGA